MFYFIYTEKSREDLRNLEKGVAKRITHKVNFYLSQPNPLQFAKRLINSSLGSYRFRVGDYRIIFDLDKKGQIIILMILRVKHRKDIYEQ